MSLLDRPSRCVHGNLPGHCRRCADVPFTNDEVGAHIEEIHQPETPRGDYRITFDLGAWRSHVITNVTYTQCVDVARTLSPSPTAFATITFLRPNG